MKKFWAIGIGVFVLFFVLGGIEGAIEASEGEEAAQAMSGLTGILTLIVTVIFGVNGNKLREKNLQSRGYDSQDLTTANYPEAAIALWMKERQDRTP